MSADKSVSLTTDQSPTVCGSDVPNLSALIYMTAVARMSNQAQNSAALICMTSVARTANRA